MALLIKYLPIVFGTSFYTLCVYIVSKRKCSALTYKAFLFLTKESKRNTSYISVSHIQSYNTNIQLQNCQQQLTTTW